MTIETIELDIRGQVCPSCLLLSLREVNRHHADLSAGRARLVVLTDRGEKLCATAAAEIAEVEAEWRAHLGTEAYEQLRAALVSLREITDPYR